MSKNVGKWAIGALVAGAAGYVAGILTAPKSGKETREDIKTTANKAKREAEQKLKVALNELTEKLDTAKVKGEKLRGKAKTEYTKVVNTATTSKEKVREVISALRSGEADDPELQEALTSARKALKSLEKYAKQ